MAAPGASFRDGSHVSVILQSELRQQKKKSVKPILLRTTSKNDDRNHHVGQAQNNLLLCSHNV